MLDLQVVPERSLGNELWEFSLGMPLFQAVHILQRHCRVIKNVDVVYNDSKPFESDLVLNLINDGIRLIFDSKNQRLKIIEIYDLSKMKLKYCGSYFNSPEVQPTCDKIDQSFGATHPAQFDEKHQMFVLSFLGITFIFPVDPQSDISTSSSLHNQTNKQNLTVGKICIYSGKNLNDTSAPQMPLTCYQGDVYSEATDVLLVGGKCDAIQLKLVTGGIDGVGEIKLQALIRQVRFGDSSQDVLTALGSPCQSFYKLEDKMRIHSAGPHKLSPSQHSDYFFNYFTFGLDILFDGMTHRVKKFVLHSNHPGHYNFNIYYRCEFRIELSGERGQFAITPTSEWDSVTEKLGGPLVVGKPVVLNRASSTNNTNPFGSTHCFGIRNMIFEVMSNNYIASLTLYQPSDVAA